MTFRSIDLQVSVQRSPEAGTIHNQMIQKPVIEQTKLENEAVKQTELARTQNAAVEESSKLDIHERQQDAGSRNPSKRNKPGKDSPDALETSSQEAAHPYKGKHIDISL
ncbi:hypothetical protein [Paenibacillus spongiae]|uniref:Uncharacterized protein n=1 Tax=Paenibacillus spongiae TaxID=2909671 RepID=A0ABY5SGC1_9BACL|nr:hypothetical protein [Paenibacillus spongiae]UVI32525.1 hypothetical protein L1F29_12155 [Paenibacillus spongiae]